MLEEKIAEQFVKILLVPTTDQYGNQKPSPVTQGIEQFVEENKSKLVEEVLKALTVEAIAKEIAERLKDYIKGIYMNSYDREQVIKSLKAEIGKHLAEKIAEDLKI